MVDSSNFKSLIDHVFGELRARLKPIYTYHSLSHTTMVLRDATFLAIKMSVSGNDLQLLQTAICLHDYGFVLGPENHEEIGCEEAKSILPGFGYTPAEVDAVCGMIMATKIPQTPKTKLERIICDADLFYLGTTYYFQVASLFKSELKALGILKTEEQWTDIQVKFLENHNYHTEPARNMLDKIKRNNLAILRSSN